MSEHNFWKYVRSSLPGIKMYRVENRVSEGMPDIHYIRNGSSGWVELKYLADWPKRNNIKIGLRLNQSFWLDEYKKLDGRCWIMIRIGTDFIGLVDGAEAKKLYEKLPVPDFLKCLAYKKFGKMTKADWAELADVITDQS
jgi:hypothetical protein|tara:strand:+ start:17645 stop:18064 length:420 start_codon:yes stop_codon:yes gene_type:complete